MTEVVKEATDTEDFLAVDIRPRRNKISRELWDWGF